MILCTNMERDKKSPRKTNITSNLIDIQKDKISNQEIIEGLISGNSVISTLFYRKYGKQINSLVWRLLGADREHDDIIQQVFLNILSSIKTIKKTDSFDSWVYGVTIRTVRKELRKRKFRKSILLFRDDTDLEDIWSQSPPSRPSHIDSFYKILNQMPLDYRIVFVLHYLERYSIFETAKICNSSLATTKRRLKKAKIIFAKKAINDFSLLPILEELGYEK